MRESKDQNNSEYGHFLRSADRILDNTEKLIIEVNPEKLQII